MSDTPRTDALIFKAGLVAEVCLVTPAGYARTLERELAALRAELAKPQPVQIHISNEGWEKLKQVLLTRFPMCRDCADCGPICPDSGLPCDLDDLLLKGDKP